MTFCHTGRKRGNPQVELVYETNLRKKDADFEKLLFVCL